MPLIHLVLLCLEFIVFDVISKTFYEYLWLIFATLDLWHPNRDFSVFQN